MLKYSSQPGTDKDSAGAYIIGRRVLDFEEDMPKNYEELLKDREFLRYALGTCKQEKQRISEFSERVANEYKQNATKIELRGVQNVLKLIQSLQSKPTGSDKRVSGRKGKPELGKTGLSSWQVLNAVLLFPVLGKVFVRGFSSLRSLLVDERWNRMRAGGALALRELGPILGD